VLHLIVLSPIVAVCYFVRQFKPLTPLLSRILIHRGLARSRCFLGYYFDATNITADVPHTMALSLPDPNSANHFQGVYWNNVETITTSGVSKCRVL
jgi:hypothetical protein